MSCRSHKAQDQDSCFVSMFCEQRSGPGSFRTGKPVCREMERKLKLTKWKQVQSPIEKDRRIINRPSLNAPTSHLITPRVLPTRCSSMCYEVALGGFIRAKISQAQGLYNSRYAAHSVTSHMASGPRSPVLSQQDQPLAFPIPLTLKQLRAYPETARNPPFPEPLEKGKVPVGSTRGKAFGLHYKLYGHGATRLIWLAGHGDRIKSWRRFALHFGHDNSEKYESLFLESRGIGESEGPLGLWTMRDLATDALEALDGLGWTEGQSVNVVGHSMGGMIAQELVSLLCCFSDLRLIVERPCYALRASLR